MPCLTDRRSSGGHEMIENERLRASKSSPDMQDADKKVEQLQADAARLGSASALSRETYYPRRRQIQERAAGAVEDLTSSMEERKAKEEEKRVEKEKRDREKADKEREAAERDEERRTTQRNDEGARLADAIEQGTMAAKGLNPQQKAYVMEKAGALQQGGVQQGEAEIVSRTLNQILGMLERTGEGQGSLASSFRAVQKRVDKLERDFDAKKNRDRTAW